MPEFISMQDLLEEVSPEERQAMEAQAKALALASDAANRCNPQSQVGGEQVQPGVDK